MQSSYTQQAIANAFRCVFWSQYEAFSFCSFFHFLSFILLHTLMLLSYWQMLKLRIYIYNYGAWTTNVVVKNIQSDLNIYSACAVIWLCIKLLFFASKNPSIHILCADMRRGSLYIIRQRIILNICNRFQHNHEQRNNNNVQRKRRKKTWNEEQQQQQKKTDSQNAHNDMKPY